jgi:hypothetical protein
MRAHHGKARFSRTPRALYRLELAVQWVTEVTPEQRESLTAGIDFKSGGAGTLRHNADLASSKYSSG